MFQYRLKRFLNFCFKFDLFTAIFFRSNIYFYTHTFFFNTHNLFLGGYYSIIWLVNYSHVTSINGDSRRNEKNIDRCPKFKQNQTYLASNVSKTIKFDANGHE